MRYLYFSLVVALSFGLMFAIGCAPKEPGEVLEDEAATEETVEEEPVNKPAEDRVVLSDEALALPAGTWIAQMEMADGGIVEWELFADDTPETVENFKQLCERRFYDNMPFHRVVKNFIVQTGDDTNTSVEYVNQYIPEEPDKNKCFRKAVSMARLADSENNYAETSGTQFFIVTKDSHHLDPGFCVFGKVITGMDVVDRIAQGTMIGRIRCVEVLADEFYTKKPYNEESK